MSSSFWDLPYRIIQPNLRNIDALKMDVKELIDRVQEYGGNVILANANGIVNWYPSELPYQQMNDYLEYDFVRDIIREAHKRKMKVLLRLNTTRKHEEVYKKHPDWFFYDINGEPVSGYKMQITCFSGHYRQKYGFKIVEELMNKYDVDGFFFHLYHYPDCMCKRCKKIYKNTTGFDIPTEEDWGDENWKSYVKYRYKVMADYAKRMREFIHKKNPEAVLAIDYHITSDKPEQICSRGWSGKLMSESVDIIAPEAFNHLTRPFPKWIYWAGEQARMGKSMGKNIFVILTYSEVSGSRRAAQPAPQLENDIIQTVAHGANPCLALSGIFDQHDRKSLPAFKDTFNFIKDNRDYYANLKPYNRTAIMYSQKTMDYYGKGCSREKSLFEYRGFYEAMVYHHFQFDVLHDGIVDEDVIQKYRTVILPNVACMSESELQIINSYVENGGNIISNFDTSLFSETGQLKQEFALSCMDFAINKRISVHGGHLSIQNKTFFKSFNDIDVMASDGEFICVTHKSKDTLMDDLFLIPAGKNSAPEYSYWTKTGREPGLALSKYGKGHIVYIPWAIGKLFHLYGVPEYSYCIADIIDYLNGEREIITNAPSSVEIVLSYSNKDVIIHVINSAGIQSKPQTEVIPIHGLDIMVKCSKKEAFSLYTNRKLTAKRSGKYLKFTIPHLEVYDVIAVN